jgi:UDP-2,3-diacylglucosamine hydrolase
MKKDDQFFGEEEWLWQYAKEVEQQSHHDYYIFGHRHLPLDLEVSNNSRYINLGEWLHFQTYASFDGTNLVLEAFEKDLPGIYISDFS